MPLGDQPKFHAFREIPENYHQVWFSPKIGPIWCSSEFSSFFPPNFFPLLGFACLMPGKSKTYSVNCGSMVIYHRYTVKNHLKQIQELLSFPSGWCLFFQPLVPRLCTARIQFIGLSNGGRKDPTLLPSSPWLDTWVKDIWRDKTYVSQQLTFENPLLLVCFFGSAILKSTKKHWCRNSLELVIFFLLKII